MKDVCVSFAVTVALRQTDVHWLEAELLRLRQEVFQTVWAQVLGAIEAQALAHAGDCPACGGPCVQNGRAPRRVDTLLGPLDLVRTRLRCQVCGAERVPLDAALGLEPGLRQTLGVQERVRKANGDGDAHWAARARKLALSAA